MLRARIEVLKLENYLQKRGMFGEIPPQSTFSIGFGIKITPIQKQSTTMIKFQIQSKEIFTGINSWTLPKSLKFFLIKSGFQCLISNSYQKQSIRFITCHAA
jgi:hypothetical protein